jgi:peptidoglycan hydrolase-like protein with peptidoglycan-binding domain
MRSSICTSGLIFAALTAGAWSLPAVRAAQSTATAPAHKATSTAATKSPTSAPKKPGKGHSKTKKVKGQQAPTADRISEIQEALASKGAFAGTPTGKWDDSTVDAMKKFQASHGLNATGKLDAPTLQKLGLGSQTAGLAAPTPPPNSINRLKNTTSSPAEPVEDQN